MSGPATRPQIGKVHAVLATLGITDRDEKLRTLSAVIYRQIGSSNELTRDEAHAAIDCLEAVSRRDDPAGYLQVLVEQAERYFAGVIA